MTSEQAAREIVEGAGNVYSKKYVRDSHAYAYQIAQAYLEALEQLREASLVLFSIMTAHYNVMKIEQDVAAVLSKAYLEKYPTSSEDDQ